MCSQNRLALKAQNAKLRPGTPAPTDGDGQAPSDDGPEAA